jgi:hypothetical protein
MRVRDFLLLVQERLAPLLPAEMRSFQARIRFNLLQVYFDQPSIHYEVWPQSKTRRIEIGLHFEADGETNTAGPPYGRAHAEVQAALGPAMELEEWTPTWTRLHHTLPMGALDEQEADEAARRLAALIQTMEPMLEECRPLLGMGPRPCASGTVARRAWRPPARG